VDGDRDFSSYMVARWPGLVRTLVLLGCRYADADRVARETFVRCHDSWAKDRDSDDIDVHVYRVVMERLERLRKRARPDQTADEQEPPLLLDPNQSDPAQRLALRRALEQSLDQVSPEERTVLVLRFVAELTEVQVADVLDVPVFQVQARQATGLSRLDLEALREVR
jgi:RNA polymerase sigma factor (sigma-70 family)